MSQDTVRTTIGRTYAVLVTQAPCTLYYQDHEAEEKLTVLTAGKPGTYTFVAFGILLKKENGSCRIVESFSPAPLGLSADRGVDGFYVTVDEDNLTINTHNNSKLINGSYLFFNQYLYTIIIESEPFSNLIEGEGMFYALKATSWNIPLPKLTRGGNMFHASKLASWTMPLPALIYAVSMFLACPITVWNIPLPNLINGINMFYSTRLTSFASTLPSLENGSNMFYECKLDKPSILIILNSLKKVSINSLITIGAAIACQDDEEITEAITSAQSRGWTVSIAYNA